MKPGLIDLQMKLKLKNGGIIKLQNAATTIPENPIDRLTDNVGLKITKVWIPDAPPPKTTFWDRLSEWFRKRKEALQSIERPKAIGPLVLTREGTKIVEHGGNLS